MNHRFFLTVFVRDLQREAAPDRMKSCARTLSGSPRTCMGPAEQTGERSQGQTQSHLPDRSIGTKQSNAKKTEAKVSKGHSQAESRL